MRVERETELKILLIYPYFIEDRIHVDEIRAMPMGIYSVAAVLKRRGYDVEVFNWYNAHANPEIIAQTLNAKRPDVIGFSILHANRWGAIEIARIARDINPCVKVVFGGVGATFLWEHFLGHFPEIDVVVLGEGEYTFEKLMRHIGRSDPKELKNIGGIGFRDGNEIIRTESAGFIKDLDELPIPAEYFAYQYVSSSRGCAWNCAFCGSPKFWEGKIRFRSPDHFVAELEMLYKKGIDFFYFSDDTFTVKRNRAIEICKKILEKGLAVTWYAISRVNYVDEEILYWMRKAGCIQISYGIESGSEKIRDVLNKRIETEQVRRAFELTTGYGILSRAYFIYGSPGEDRETIRETIDFMDQLRPLSTIFYLLDLFPGTRLYEMFKEKSGATDDIWLNKIEGILYFETDSRLSEEMVLSFGKQLRTAYYEKVSAYADNIKLTEKKDLYETHADFLSRLAMTFSHGDYAKIGEIKDKAVIAEKLYRRSLGYAPNHRAFLGLGMLKQKQGEFKASIDILTGGVQSFPKSESLHICLGISLMNHGDFEVAVPHFLKFPESKQARDCLAACRKALA